MQSYRAGLSQALAKHEDQLKAQASPSEGDKGWFALVSLSGNGLVCGERARTGLQGCGLA